MSGVVPNLCRHVREIVHRERDWPRLNDDEFEAFKESLKTCWTRNDSEVISRVAPTVIPAWTQLPDRRLENEMNELWSRAKPVTSSPGLKPLAKLKPDLAFGYSSKEAFNAEQRRAIRRLQKHAKPGRRALFPFLVVEFKARADGGTHYTALHQAANAGAIAMNGCLELARQAPDEVVFDATAPGFFSLSIDDHQARVYGHWHSRDEGQDVFNAAEISLHMLGDRQGLEQARDAVRNILDYAVNERLTMISQSLNAYWKKVLEEEESEDDLA